MIALLATGLCLTGCAPEPSGGPPEGQSSGPALSAPDPRQSLHLTILHPFQGGEGLADLEALIVAFSVAHPEVVVREDFARDLLAELDARSAAGAPVDVMFHRDPLVLATLIEQERVKPLNATVDVSMLASTTISGVLDSVTSDGQLFAVPFRLDVKSLVWFSPRLFEANGYEVPVTWDGMLELSDRMRSDGIAPWCIGIESGPATGWVATDWVEDVLLRALGADQYDRWVMGELPFASFEVQYALERYLVPIWTDERVLGGRAAIAQEPWVTSTLGAFEEVPSCGLHRQGLLIEPIIADSFPASRFGIDHDFFLLPGLTLDDRPVLGSVDFATRLTENPAAEMFVRFLADLGSEDGPPGPDIALSPFAPVLGPSEKADGARYRAGEILASATVFRSDGSDRMPRAVGASDRPGSFWTEMTAWVDGRRSLEDALGAIDSRYAEVLGR